ncbi:formimidoylglutamase [Ideonella paludis]|uniref:Formimidoylglutamase n=2 Tax=Ideonella paludis TaxID=1233411 RepID=A0ABS5DYP3_9BURK|nr:formimidoylglutamase [Ideonella paludis]
MDRMEHSFEWQGRIDAEETGDSRRWHQVMQAWGPGATSGCALIGFAVDEGVRRNGGRPGAAEGPAACRKFLANMPLMGEPALWDAGDVRCDGGALEAAQARLAGQVAASLQQGCLPLVMGGGHEVAWGTFQGLLQGRPEVQRWLIINLDAHFDLRYAAAANSGTPFLQIQQRCQALGLPFDYRVLGISRYANTRALFDRAQALGVRYWLDEDLQDAPGLAAAQQALAQDLAACEAVYLTACLDVLPGAQAPGVSAPSPLGVPLAAVEAVVAQVVASGKLAAFDVAELNPSLDRDGLTARIAARLIAKVARR